MSKLWDDLKDNMKDWSVTAVEKAEEMSKIAVAKTEEMTRISKVKFDIGMSSTPSKSEVLCFDNMQVH